MLYLTGIHALNLSCDLETCGDWHTSALRWRDLTIRDSEQMFFKEYGIEGPKNIPDNNQTYYVANHIRALLDLLQEGTFTVAQGMNDDFICNEKYDNEVFEKVYQLNQQANWDKINSFMKREYKMKWVNWLKSKTKISDNTDKQEE